MKKHENSCVLLYKPQDHALNEYPVLLKDDFFLIIMNEAQCEMLKKFGSDCICVHETHGTNK